MQPQRLHAQIGIILLHKPPSRCSFLTWSVNNLLVTHTTHRLSDHGKLKICTSLRLREDIGPSEANIAPSEGASSHLLSSSAPAERVREHQPHHVRGQPAAGVGPLRLPADQADLGPAGAGVEGLRRSAGRAQHAAGDVGQLPPEMRPGAW